MRAMVLTSPGSGTLTLDERTVPVPGARQVLVAVAACGVCRTDLHVVDGELPSCRVPVVPGHEVVGRVVATGAEVSSRVIGDRVGVPWLGHVCGSCEWCASGRENLCETAEFTGCHLDGGYAEYLVADEDATVSIPAAYDDSHAAPLLCAGLIGYRAYRMAGEARRIGMYGFGAAAHILAQVARHESRQVFAFVRPGDDAGIEFARRIGVAWAGTSADRAPVPLDAGIIFAPAGPLVPKALADLSPGGRLICAGIHMSDIPTFPYSLLWKERSIQSVANLTRQDANDFMTVAARVPIDTHVESFPLTDANEALRRLRDGRVEGTAVLIP
jgi:alcohol dehydrogenase, propanol-preferring